MKRSDVSAVSTSRIAERKFFVTTAFLVVLSCQWGHYILSDSTGLRPLQTHIKGKHSSPALTAFKLGDWFKNNKQTNKAKQNKNEEEEFSLNYLIRGW